MRPAVTIGMMRNRGMKVLPEERDQFLKTAEYFKTLTDAGGKKLTDQTAPRSGCWQSSAMSWR